MKKATLFLVALALVAVIIMTGCSKTETQPQPAPQAAAQPEPPPPPPPKEEVTLTSKSPFLEPSLSYSSGEFETWANAHSAAKEGLQSLTRPREQFSETRYVTVLGPLSLSGRGNTAIVRFVRIPSNAFANPDMKSLNLDDPKFETLSSIGWKIGTRITVHVFQSEFGSRRSVLVGNREDAKERTLDELQRDPYFWRIIRNSAGQLFAEPDKRGMLTSFSAEGLTAYLVYLQKESPHKDSLEAIKRGGDESYSAGYQTTYLAGQYRYLWSAFSRLPQPAQLILIDQLGPALARYAIDQAGPDIVRRYVTDLMWDRISRIDPTKDQDSLSWWPHQDEDAVVAYYGLSKKQYRDLAPVMLFWARRGQPVFERVKAVFARELARTPIRR